MPRTAIVLKVLVSSPEDVAEERKCLESIIRELNLTWSKDIGIILELVRWETHSYPGVGVDSQAVINEQIGDDYDIFIGIMWKRFGTPTNRAGSGTVEEFNRAYERFREDPDQVRIMFYFNNAPVPPAELEPQQLTLLTEFRNKVGQKGTLYWFYTTLQDFQSFVRMHLSRQLQEYNKSWGMGGKRESKLEEAEVINISGGESNEITEADIGEEEGFLDLIEIGQENFEIVTETTKRMTEAIKILGDRTKERTSEMEQLQISKGNVDVKAAKRISNHLAEDMEQYVNQTEKEIPLFAQSHSKATGALARATTLLSDFKIKDKSSLLDTLKMIQDYKGSIQKSHEAMTNYRRIIANLPRITTRFNHAKRQTLSILERLLNEWTTAMDLTSEVEKTFLMIIADAKSET